MRSKELIDYKIIHLGGIPIEVSLYWVDDGMGSEYAQAYAKKLSKLQYVKITGERQIKDVKK